MVNIIKPCTNHCAAQEGTYRSTIVRTKQIYDQSEISILFHLEVVHPEMQNTQFLPHIKEHFFKMWTKKVLWQRLSEERVFTFRGMRLGSYYLV